MLYKCLGVFRYFGVLVERYLITNKRSQRIVPCPSCGSATIRMRGYLLCPRCGVDCPDTVKRFDEYWTRGDESQVVSEMDDYFYQRYPEFRN